MRHQHIRIAREEPSNERKPGKPPRKPLPDDPRGVGTRLQASLRRALESDTSAYGYDVRRLLKLEVAAGFRPEDLAAIQGIEVLSQEEKTVVLAFADARAVETFEQRLTMLARNGTVTKKEIFFALSAFENWTPEDRKGVALARYNAPDGAVFVVDVELWPLAKPSERLTMLARFDAFLEEHEIEKLDSLDKTSLLMCRVRTSSAGLNDLLSHRDVRLVDLPPRYGLETELLTIDVNQLPQIDSPPDGAALIGILDSGIVSAHPMLGVAVGEAAGFVPPDREPSDASGHGTRVAGLALYGDIRTCVQQGRFVPELRLLSGRVFDNDGQDQSRFVEKSVEEAVRYFHGAYGCRVFSFSYGDQNKVYDGRHVRGLSYVLDSLARELGVLFVVPTGNLRGEDIPENPANTYPSYLLEESSRLLDPAPALNALTVGGVSLFEADVNAQRYENYLEGIPIAHTDQPAPFTRCGPSINGAIKPDIVEHAGNLAIPRHDGGLEHRRLGVLSLNHSFASGPPFNEAIGTSYAVPQVAHVAARLLNHLPEASANLLRALLIAHARWPEPTIALLTSENGRLDTKSLVNLCGYGRIQRDALFESLDNAVTLYSEDTLQNDHHHFYELPLPSDLWLPGKRSREITICLAHSPDVRTTRVDYRATQLSFHLVSKSDLATVSDWFKKARAEDAAKVAEYSYGRSVTAAMRGKGIVQCATWHFETARSVDDFKLFVVVTRHDVGWSDVRATPEPYALTITIEDRENVTGQLYNQIQERLQQREQVRLRTRARTAR